MPRGMSRCRICGKSIPSFFRPHHEKVACLEMKRRKGLLFRTDVRTFRKPREEENTVDKKLMLWHPKNVEKAQT